MNLPQTFFKTAFNFLLLVLILTISFLPVKATGEVDPVFNPALVQVKHGGSIYNRIERMAVQPDGKALIAGLFRTAGKFARDGIARLNADGTVDTTFHPPVIYSTNFGFGGIIFAVTLQPDGKILIGGDFNTVGGLTRPGIARLNADGSLDTSFNIQGNSPTSFSGTIYDIKVSADNKITFAGNFTYTSSGTRNTVARVLADGTPDTSFSSPSIVAASTVINRVEVLSSGKTLISGGTGGNNNFTGFVYRLNADGSVDATFSAISTSNPNVGTGSPAVLALKVQPDGKFLAGGGFTQVNGYPLKGLARFNADGSIDTSFANTAAGPDGEITSIEILPNGMILVGGNFSTYNGVNRVSVALLDANGNLDNSLVYSGTRLQTTDAAALPNGKILISQGLYTDDIQPALIRINADGSLDSTFNLLVGFNGVSNKVFVQSDGKILIGGIFTHTDNQIRFNLSRVNADGTLDTTFTPPVSDTVYGLDVRADGKILVSTASGVIRLNANGSIDTMLSGGGVNASYDAKFLPGGGAIITIQTTRLRKTFEAGGFDPSLDVTADAAIRKILIQPDGKFIVAGDFTQIAGVTRGRIARINADGTLDTTFNPAGGASNSIFDAALQPDGKIIVGGNFPGINFNNNYKYLARLNPDGSLDTSFNPVVNGGIQSLKIEPNGKILIGGAMYLVNGVTRSGIARLNQDGSLDTAFNPGAGTDNSVLSIDLQANGAVIIGGAFTHVNNQDRLGGARLLDTVSARTLFDFDGDGRADISVFRPSNGTWYWLNSTSNQFAGQQFGLSSDIIVPADYDGDGKTDLAVFRSGVWYIQQSSQGFTGFAFGQSGDIPVPADYDGDGRADIAVYRPSDGIWYIQRSMLGFTAVQFGAAEDKPTPGDFDGDGKADVAVFRPSNGTWYRINSSTNQFFGQQFGVAEDKPVPADYDGDGKTDIAVFRPSTGIWYLLESTNGFTGYQFGQSTDEPVPADYDGDGKADIAVFRNGVWYLQQSTNGFAGVLFGASTDAPVPNAFVR